MSDPDYYAIISREAVVTLANRPDALGELASRMLASTDEQEVFRNASRAYISKADQSRRRLAIAALAQAFSADRAELKRLLRFWGIVNERD
jgi:hypothetical protein